MSGRVLISSLDDPPICAMALFDILIPDFLLFAIIFPLISGSQCLPSINIPSYAHYSILFLQINGFVNVLLLSPIIFIPV